MTKTMKNKMMIFGMVALLATAGTGCVEKKTLVDVGMNEFAYEVIAEGKNASQTFSNADRDQWEEQLAQKRRIPVRRVRVHLGGLEWKRVPERFVVKGSFSPVAKNWSSHSITKHQNGTYNVTNENMMVVESETGAVAYVPVNLTAKIADSSTYMTSFGVVPSQDKDGVVHNAKELGIVIEDVIKPAIQGILSREFGVVATEDMQSQKNDVFDRVKPQVEELCDRYGIEIITFDMDGSLVWDDHTIQLAIEETARQSTLLNQRIAEQAVEQKEAETKRKVAEIRQDEINNINISKAETARQIAEKAREEQEILNSTKFGIAQTERMVAEEQAKTIDTLREMNQLEIDLLHAKAEVLYAEGFKENWNGIQFGANATHILGGADSEVLNTKLRLDSLTK